MKPKTLQTVKDWLAWLLVIPTTIISLVAGLYLLLKLWRDRVPWTPDILPPDLDELDGLTDEETDLRRTYDPEEEDQRARRKINRAILRRNVVSIFNISLLGLAIVTFMLDDILGALATLGVMLANIVVNTVQQAFAVHNVDKIAVQSRPKVNVIRSGESKGIRIDEIVVGDVLVVGLGDQILTDGHILRAADNLRVDDTAFSETNQGSKKTVGDALQAGSYCVAGWAAYEVNTLPAEELRTTQLNAIPETSADLTPLQKIIDQILRILLVLLAIFVFMLIHSIAQWDVIPPDVQILYRDVASIMFSIAPSGLFFMIIVSYNMGTFDLLKLGALVRDSRSVESLAQVTTICFGKSGTLTGIDVQVEMLPQSEDTSALGESRVRQIIGDFAHNSSSLSPFLTEMRKTFEGQPRPISSESRFLSTYGWSGLNFRDPDLKGTYVLGRPGLLQIEIPEEQVEAEAEGDGEQQDSVVQRTWGRLRGVFTRGESEPELELEGVANPEQITQPNGGTGKPQDGAESIEEDTPGIFGRLKRGVTNIVRRETPADDSSSKPEEPIVDPSRLVFAYSPEEQSLFDQTGHPSLPENLAPLSYLTFTEQIRPEAKEAIEIFTDAGVQVNIISQQNTREVEVAARQLGLEEIHPGGLKTLSGIEIERMSSDQLPQVFKETTIFAPVTAEQKGEIIESLRDGGEYVAMTGEGLSDIDAMRQANLSISIQGVTQAAVSFADIILLKDSLQALPRVLQQGRRIVNGLIDVLKLNLVQVVYIFVLLIAMILLKNKIFFYDPTQGGLIVFFTIVIPSIGLTFWATSGAISEKNILSQLLRFIIPLGITSALASLVTSYIFNYLTRDPKYAQLGVTYTLTLTGILMVLFIKPPNKFWVGDSSLSGDKRFVWMVLVMFLLFGIVLMIPLAQELLKVAPLRELDHYLIIVGITLVWVVVTKLIWWLPGLRWVSK
ncbi:HAD family hydrolase [Chloroflexota bacterium]